MIHNGMTKISAAIARMPNLAALLMPKTLARAIVTDVYPEPDQNDVLHHVVHAARANYLTLVATGGYIGTIMSVPVLVADDVILCPLSEADLDAVTARLKLDKAELARHRARGSYKPQRTVCL